MKPDSNTCAHWLVIYRASVVSLLLDMSEVFLNWPWKEQWRLLLSHFTISACVGSAKLLQEAKQVVPTRKQRKRYTPHSTWVPWLGATAPCHPGSKREGKRWTSRLSDTVWGEGCGEGCEEHLSSSSIQATVEESVGSMDVVWVPALSVWVYMEAHETQHSGGGKQTLPNRNDRR